MNSWIIDMYNQIQHMTQRSQTLIFILGSHLNCLHLRISQIISVFDSLKIPTENIREIIRVII